MNHLYMCTIVRYLFICEHDWVGFNCLWYALPILTPYLKTIVNKNLAVIGTQFILSEI